MTKPMLRCPECGTPLIAPHGRGRYDRDGNYHEHRDGCRCAWCDWMWFDDADPVRCQCGSLVCVDANDDHASAKIVQEGTKT